MNNINETSVEIAALAWLQEIGYRTGFGPDDAQVGVEREEASDAVLWRLVKEALERLNPNSTSRERSDALKRIQRAESQDLILENYRYHNLLVEGVPVESKAADGHPITKRLRLVDFEDPSNNDWFALNQFTIIENGHN
ncbi:MAG: type I restriction endonuclease, partial [Acidobacteriota bacterium]|nr:type I restriction endonuclease [Acidobacteriota bacterium]